MPVQAASTAAATINAAGHVVPRSFDRQATTHLMAISSLQKKAPGETVFADEVEVPMTRNDIADYLGLTIETVSRTLTKLKQDGLIARTTSARLAIQERDRLEELAAGESASEF